MGLIGRALRLAFASAIVASIASTAWAVVARRRFVPRGGPESWRVRVRVRSFFGGVADGRPRIDRPDGAPELTIDGLAFFGGFAIQQAARVPAQALAVEPGIASSAATP